MTHHLAAAGARERGLRGAFQRWGPLMLAVTVLLAFWALIATWAVLQRARVVESAERELSQLTSAVALHAGALLAGAETGLRTLDVVLSEGPRRGAASSAAFVAVADEVRRGSDGLLDLRVVSADGLVFAIPPAGGEPLADVSAQAFFTVHRHDSERALHIGDPEMGPARGQWDIPVTWRVRDPRPDAYALYAKINLDRLFVLHERMRVKPNGTIALVRADGMVLSRTPPGTGLIGRSRANARTFVSEYGARRKGVFVSDGSIGDGVERLVSYERVERFPVSVLVTQPTASILASWRERRDLAVIGGAVLTVAILAAAILLHRMLARRRLAEDEMRLLAATDSLTGLPNRRALLEFAQREFARSRRYARPLAILFLDLDHFKRVNDGYGHAAGDRVLRDCAAKWSARLRSGDLLGRTGGEEFCAILPETAHDVAVEVARQLCELTRAIAFPDMAPGLGVSVSVGLACLEPTDQHLAELVHRADRALYLAKHGGRDRVQFLREIGSVEGPRAGSARLAGGPE